MIIAADATKEIEFEIGHVLFTKIERKRDAAPLVRQSNNGAHGQKRLGTERPASKERAINAS